MRIRNTQIMRTRCPNNVKQTTLARDFHRLSLDKKIEKKKRKENKTKQKKP